MAIYIPAILAVVLCVVHGHRVTLTCGNRSIPQTTTPFGESLQGPKGAKGIQGPKGDIGPSGEQGEIGEKGMKGETGDDSWREAFFELQKEVDELKIYVTKNCNTPNIDPMQNLNANNPVDCNNGFSYGGVCIRYNETVDIQGYGGARRYCWNDGGVLADITSQEMYDELYDYLLENVEEGTSFWLGNTYESGTVRTSGGKVVDLLPSAWRASFPSSHASSNLMGLQVQTPEYRGKLKGLVNRLSLYQYKPLCQYG